MELAEVVRTTFAAREFTDQPVTDEVLYRLLDLARFAPSGGNRQGWSVILVRDPATKAELARLAEPGARRYTAQRIANEVPWNSIVPTQITDQEIDRTEPWATFTQPIVDAPVVLVVCVDLAQVASFDQYLDRVGVVTGASVYPFAWNVLLAARDEGLGGTISTLSIAREPEVRELLGIPEHVAVATLLLLGYPARRLTRLRRSPVEDFTYLERWGGEPFGG